MRVFVRIRISMMHPVHNRIGPWAHKGGALGDIGEKIKKPLPAFAHRKCTMSCIAVLKKGLGKKREVPVGSKKYQYNHRLSFQPL